MIIPRSLLPQRLFCRTKLAVLVLFVSPSFHNKRQLTILLVRERTTDPKSTPSRLMSTPSSRSLIPRLYKISACVSRDTYFCFFFLGLFLLDITGLFSFLFKCSFQLCRCNRKGLLYLLAQYMQEKTSPTAMKPARAFSSCACLKNMHFYRFPHKTYISNLWYVFLVSYFYLSLSFFSPHFCNVADASKIASDISLCSAKVMSNGPFILIRILSPLVLTSQRLFCDVTYSCL